MSPMVLIHTLDSLVALLAGLALLPPLLRGRAPAGLTAFSLATSVFASASGYLLPAAHLLPSHIVGALSLLLLAAALYARYARRLAGGWGTVDAVGLVLSTWLLAFVTVAQAFAKIAALKALAPTQQEPPFAAAEAAVLLVFAVLTVLAVRGVRHARLQQAI